MALFYPSRVFHSLSTGFLWSVLGRVCLRLPGFASLLGWNFYKQEEEGAQTKKSFCDGTKVTVILILHNLHLAHRTHYQLPLGVVYNMQDSLWELGW